MRNDELPEIKDRASGSASSSRRRFVGLVAGTAGIAMAPAFLRHARGASPIVVKLSNCQGVTGPSAAWGIRCRDGARAAADEIKKAGGFADQKGNQYVFEMTEDDMADDPKQAISLFRQRSLDRGIVAQIGPANSKGYLACVPVAQQIKLPFIGNGSGAPVKDWNIWSYRVNPVSGTATPLLLRIVAKQESVKRMAVLYDQTQDGQVGHAEVVKSMASQLGYEVVAFEASRPGDQSYLPQISKIKANKPDAIFVGVPTGDGVRAVTQMRQSGLEVPLLTGDGAFHDPVYWDGTKGGIKGAYTYQAQDLDKATGTLKQWLDSYNKTYSLTATSYSLYGYDSLYTVAECIKRANGIDRNKIREALASLEFTTPLGAKISFRNPPHGNNLTPSLSILRVTGRGTAETIPG